MIHSKTESSEEHGPGNSYGICFRKPCLSYHFGFVLADENAPLGQFRLAPSESYKSLDCHLGSLKWVLPLPFHFLFSFGLLCLCPLFLFSTYFSRVHTQHALIFPSLLCVWSVLWINLQLLRSHQQTFKAAFYNPTTLRYSSHISCLTGCWKFLAAFQQPVQTLHAHIHWDITYC